MPVYTYTTLDDPLAVGGDELGTFSTGINAAGQIVGFYNDATGTHGFLYSNGTYTTLDDPLSTSRTFAYGINDTDQIVGQYFAGGHGHGFLYDPTSHVFPPYFTLDDPSATVHFQDPGTSAIGINATRQIVGWYYNNGTHGFLLTGLFAFHCRRTGVPHLEPTGSDRNDRQSPCAWRQ